jgi:hypothetical protein
MVSPTTVTYREAAGADEKERGDALKPPYAVPHLRRFPLGTPYPRIVEQGAELPRTQQLRGSFLMADQTGVGRAVVDMLADAMAGRFVGVFCPVTITSGHEVTLSETGEFRVPKKELVGVLQVLLQTRRLRISQALPEAAILAKELETFQVKITDAANEVYGAWRAGQHDDLVLATGLAAWAGEKWLGQGDTGV